jgi:hypothetical protein
VLGYKLFFSLNESLGNLCLGKRWQYTCHFPGRGMGLKMTIWERFTGFGKSIHSCPPPTHHKLSVVVVNCPS